MTTKSDFRSWVNRMWMEYQDEVECMNSIQSCSTPQEYFRKYRWWLRSKYKEEMLPKKTRCQV